MEITKKIIDDNFGKEIINRGYNYYKQQRVTNLFKSGNKISATVLGSDDYTTEIEIKDNALEIGCDCPYEGTRCKHAVAVLYAAMNEKIKEPRFKEILSNKTKEELLELLLFVLHEEPKLATRINLKEVKLKDEINSIFSKYDWREGRAAIRDLKSILRGVEFSRGNNPDENLIGEMKESIKALSKGLDKFDDSGGGYSEFLLKWVNLYARLFKSSSLAQDNKKRKEFILEMLEHGLRDDYGLEDCYYTPLVEFIELRDLEFIRGKIKEEIEKLKDKYRKEDLIELLLSVYDKLRLHDKFLILAERHGYSEKTIEKLMELERLGRALEICNDKIRNIRESFRKQHLLELRGEILLKMGDGNRAVENFYHALTLDPNEDNISQLKKLCVNNGNWGFWKEKLGKFLIKQEDKYLFIKFCLSEKEYVKAYDAARLMLKMHPFIVEKTAQAIEDVYPEKAAHLYQLLAENIMEYNAGRASYMAAVSYLRKAIQLTNDKSWGIYINGLKEAHNKKYALVEELSRIKVS